MGEDLKALRLHILASYGTESLLLKDTKISRLPINAQIVDNIRIQSLQG